MRRIKEPHWIKHSHLFDPDKYECSASGAVHGRSLSVALIAAYRFG